MARRTHLSLTDGEFWLLMLVGSPQQENPLRLIKPCSYRQCGRVRLLSRNHRDVACRFYRKTADGRQNANDHPFYELLHNQPNADMTAVGVLEMIMASLFMGNAYGNRPYRKAYYLAGTAQARKDEG